MPKLLSTVEVADMIGLQPNTLERWRLTGEGPAHIRCGRLVRYDIADVHSWLASRRVVSTSQAA